MIALFEIYFLVQVITLLDCCICGARCIEARTKGRRKKWKPSITRGHAKHTASMEYRTTPQKLQQPRHCDRSGSQILRTANKGAVWHTYQPTAEPPLLAFAPTPTAVIVHTSLMRFAVHPICPPVLAFYGGLLIHFKVFLFSFSRSSPFLSLSPKRITSNYSEE